MRLKTWLVAAIGLGSLVVLLAVSMVAASRKAEDIYAQLEELNAHHRRVEASLQRLRSDVNLSGIFVRDYLLDVARERAPEYRDRLTEFRRTSIATLGELSALLGPDDRIASLQAKLDDYWEAFEPLFDWTTAEKILNSSTFLRSEVVPRREAALALAQEIEELNNANLAVQRDEVARRHVAFRNALRQLLVQTILLGLGVAVVVMFRLRVLERRSEHAEDQMRELSQQLVSAQEQERKNLSRELHDHVAQVLTGLRMELGRIERTSPAVSSVVAECKRLVDELFGTVRNLALGLRPSMLDDFGLPDTLRWYLRKFSDRTGVRTELVDDHFSERLPIDVEVCVYRVVQEALTNVSRHAKASACRVFVQRVASSLIVTVEDDGIGWQVPMADRRMTRDGLGLVGIRERVEDLGGRFRIEGKSGKGTRLTIELPLAARG